MIESSGIRLASGQDHQLGYKKKTTFLLPPPYTTCTDSVPLSMKIMLDTYYSENDYGYAETICYQLCEQAYTYSSLRDLLISNKKIDLF